MVKKLSLAAIAVLATSVLHADSFDIEDALKSGSFGGDFTLYGESIDAKPDSGFSMGSLGLHYESARYRGFGFAAGFRANNDLSEKENGDYSDGDEPKALLHTANISYTNEAFTVIGGRQELDLEWAGDYHEALVGVFTGLPNTTITLAHTIRLAVADTDAPLEKFEKFNGSDGAQVLDVAYEGVENTMLNAYYYNANDLASWYGAKAAWDTETFGLTAHGAFSNEDTQKDGSILHAEVRGTFINLGLSAGYITTDKDVGAGTMSALGDNINPLEEGDKVYGADAKTTYVGVTYEIGALSLGALYGHTKYGSDKEKEFNFTAEYAFSDAFSLGALIVDVNAQDSDEDYTKFSLNAVYAF
ncbi:MAG: Opr family porin [Campylobacterales bacterium]|nr:Opr family porin [Campylobacterales bacterium]